MGGCRIDIFLVLPQVVVAAVFRVKCRICDFVTNLSRGENGGLGLFLDTDRMAGCGPWGAAP